MFQKLKKNKFTNKIIILLVLFLISLLSIIIFQKAMAISKEAFKNQLKSKGEREIDEIVVESKKKINEILQNIQEFVKKYD
ncbi:MAG: hypothetical protein Q8781_01470, partial [Candidatus Phytoplasma stylosanthis]|uniref:hypothetical protein n=1 Tax=Candidatus Phytoplasma stylosanthis TaxID=2798314 RepID=UPI00293B7E5A